MSSAKQPDWEAVERDCREHGIPEIVYAHLPVSGEKFLSGVFRLALASEKASSHLFDGLVPEIIRAEAEYNVPRGRIDYLLFHADGSVTVCELKDGRKGKQHVLTGVGQVISYSIQIGMANAGLSKIRKALVFTSWGRPDEEILVIESCESAGVMAISMGSEADHRKAAMDLIESRVSNGSQKTH